MLTIIAKILPTGVVLWLLSKNLSCSLATLVFTGHIRDTKIPVNVFIISNGVWLCKSQKIELESLKRKLERKIEDLNEELEKYGEEDQ